MNEYIYIGKIVNTHALKGEVRVISNFEYKDQVFKVNNTIFIGKEKHEEIINTYRKHKEYDMITFVNKNKIEDVIKYKSENVYVLKSSITLNENDIFKDELIGMKVIFNNKEIGVIEDFRSDNGNKLIYVSNKYLPFNNNFIESIDKNNNRVYYKNIENLL